MCARALVDELLEGQAEVPVDHKKVEVATMSSSSPSPSPPPQRRFHPKSGHHKFMDVGNVSPPTMDTLATMTAYTKVLVEHAYDAVDWLQNSKLYIVFARTTQPAHAALFMAVLAVASCLALPSDTGASPGAALLHLGCFSTHFGAQLWMTFVSGLSLYFSIPRHNFGAVQRVLFPRYFALNAALSLGSLLGFVRQHPTNTWNNLQAVQGIVLTACFLGELIVRLYFTGPLLALMSAKEAIERRAGVGTEIGRQDVGALAQCPHYTRLHGAFRKVHITIAIVNMACLCTSALHLHYLAQRLATVT